MSLPTVKSGREREQTEHVGFALMKSGDSFHKAATLSLQHHKINSAQIGREDGVH